MRMKHNKYGIKYSIFYKILIFTVIIFCLLNDTGLAQKKINKSKKTLTSGQNNQYEINNSQFIFKNNEKKDLKDQKILNETILAHIGDKIITEDEFIRRSEYTIRPNYCKGDGGLEKKIILNSLIAEKLVSIEYGKDNQLLKNDHYKRYILGRQEQVMRQMLYYEEGYQKVKLDTNEIKKLFKIAGRTYDLKYFTVYNDSMAKEIDNKFRKEKKSFESIYNDLTATENYPMARIDWKCKENENIMKALFTDTLGINQLISTLKVDDTTWMFIEVKGWTYKPAITEKAAMERWKDVSDKLMEDKSYEVYGEFIAKIMKGKQINFFSDTYMKYVNLVAPFYLKSKQQKQQDEAFLNMTFDRPIETPKEIENKKSLNDISGENIFEIDGKTWTVAQLQTELEKHPLVFRKKKFKNPEFAENLKLAIVDMVRDNYLTQSAYEKGYNKSDIVKKNIEMWTDAEFALFWKYNMLKENPGMADIKKADSIMLKTQKEKVEPEIARLQKKYSEKIFINTDMFNKIKLTHTPMAAIQKNVPFPLIVPSFPQLTTENKLNYGKKIQK